MSISLGGSSMVAAGATHARTSTFQGLPCTQLSLPSGDSVTVAHFGGQVISWITADGYERLYLSPATLQDHASPIRGGVPVCFPQFNQRVLGPVALPKHGFARTQGWNLQGLHLSGTSAVGTFGLSDSTATRALWPHGFAATLTVSLRPGTLQLEFSVRNTSDQPWPFALALHTYLRVDAIAATSLQGLAGHTYWDAVRHPDAPQQRETQAEDSLVFTAETDRVYEGVRAPLTLTHRAGRVQVSQSESLPEVVVWNPAAARCATLPDMPADGWQHMLCVEAACINQPVVLAPGAAWSGWQALAVLPPSS